MSLNNTKKIIIFLLITCIAIVNGLAQNEQYDTKQCDKAYNHISEEKTNLFQKISRGGASLIPPGYHPFGYKLTVLGETFLSFDGSLDSDIGRFLASFKSGKRKTKSDLKDVWLEIVRVSKKGQSMRILRRLDEFIDFCLNAGFLN